VCFLYQRANALSLVVSVCLCVHTCMFTFISRYVSVIEFISVALYICQQQNTRHTQFDISAAEFKLIHKYDLIF
jgi:hypothetical protein